MDGVREGAGQAAHIIENHTHTVAFTQSLESAAPCSWSLITFFSHIYVETEFEGIISTLSTTV